MNDPAFEQTGRKSFFFEICVLVAILALYGRGEPWSVTSDLFIPVDMYRYGTESVAAILAVYWGTRIFRAKSLDRFDLIRSFSYVMRSMIYALLPFAIYYVVILSSFGFGEIVTEAFGTKTNAVYDVIKDQDTQRLVKERSLSRRYERITAHCLLSDQFANAVIPEEYCISSNSNFLPNNQFGASFSAKKTIIGTVIKGFNGQATTKPSAK